MEKAVPKRRSADAKSKGKAVASPKATNSKQKKSPAIKILKFNEGELIFKEGDYGISFYRILTGKVRLTVRYGDKELTVKALGPGETLGEVAVLQDGAEPHAASAWALEDAELEVWHRKRFLHEYKQLPGPLKYLISQDLQHLTATRSLIIRMQLAQEDKKRKETGKRSWSSQRRRHYRKELNVECLYRPIGAPDKVWFSGIARDISKEGLGIEVHGPPLIHYSHDIGEKFEFDLDLPNGNKLVFRAMIVSTGPGKSKGSRFWGMSIINISLDAQKKLGFFLLP